MTENVMDSRYIINPKFTKILAVYAVEPVGKGLQKCLEAKERLWPNPSRFLNTIADSIRLQAVSALLLDVSVLGFLVGLHTLVKLEILHALTQNA